MTDKQVLHPEYGRSVLLGATDTCSKCGHTIPEERVPLMMWDDTGDVMWVFCATCEKPLLSKLAPSLKGKTQ